MLTSVCRNAVIFVDILQVYGKNSLKPSILLFDMQGSFYLGLAFRFVAVAISLNFEIVYVLLVHACEMCLTCAQVLF